MSILASTMAVQGLRSVADTRLVNSVEVGAGTDDEFPALASCSFDSSWPFPWPVIISPGAHPDFGTTSMCPDRLAEGPRLSSAVRGQAFCQSQRPPQAEERGTPASR